MLSALLLAASISQPCIFVNNARAVGLFEDGKWTSMESKLSQSFPKQTTKQAIIEQVNRGSVFSLDQSGECTPADWKILAFDYSDEGTWFVGKTENAEPGVEPELELSGMAWFGPKLSKPKMKVLSNGAPATYAIAQRFMRAKGVKNPRPILSKVIVADLDQNGKDETIIFGGSAKSTGDGLFQLLAGQKKIKTPGAYAFAFISYSAGSQTKYEVIHFERSDNGLKGYFVYSGLWNLDGKPGLELLIEKMSYSQWNSQITKFSKNELQVVAEIATDGWW